ncbi:MAG: lipid-A-disaccharide synthase [Pseudomonadota bacterium]
MSPSDGPLIFLVAGEPSGDQLGARLMAALKRQTGGRVRFAGLGGEQMAEQGLTSLFPIDELSILGIVEVLPHIRRIYQRIRETVAAVQAARPAALVTIDSPSFSLEVSQRLKGQGIPLIHYVAPTVWAWKPWRAKKMAGYLDHLLALLPFEPPYFETHGLATTVVGHPAVERTAGPEAAAELRATLGIAPDAPLVCVLPGSRRGEVSRLLPVFGGALGQLAERVEGLRVVLPTVGGVADQVGEAVERWTVPVEVLQGAERKFAAFAAADVGLAASGTVTVELAVSGLPSVVAYKVSPLSAMIARRLLKIDHAAMPSLVLGREVQPELLQENCTADKLADAVGRLLSDPTVRQAQLDNAAAAAKLLGYGDQAPSEKAAAKILEIIG